MSIKNNLIIVAVFLSILLMSIFFALPRHGEVVYNCSIAEISPDYPPEVKEQCRNLNVGKRYKK
jgi:branched-subunit amino acid permease